MITRMRLTNFQGHRDSTLDFVPGVNVIAGESHTGKSSIMRALQWLATNRPSGAGEKWQHWGADKKDMVAVEILLDNGVVTRFRQGSKNGYRIMTEPDVVTDLMAIRSDLPKEVDQILLLGEHNIQTQHLGYFLLTDTPGEVARKLNNVCGLNIIDSCLKNANQLLVKNEQDVRANDDNMVEYIHKLEQIGDLEGMEKAVARVEQDDEEINSLTKHMTQLQASLNTVRAAEEVVADLDEFLKVEPQVQALLAQHEEIEELEQQVNRLTKILDTLLGIEKIIGEENHNVMHGEIAFQEALEKMGICPLCGRGSGE